MVANQPSLWWTRVLTANLYGHTCENMFPEVAQDNPKLISIRHVMGVQNATWLRDSWPLEALVSYQNVCLLFPPTHSAAAAMPDLCREPWALCCVTTNRPPLQNTRFQLIPLQSRHPAGVWTYCAPPAPGSCRICGSLWHSTPTQCSPERSLPPSPRASLPTTPGCCCKAPGPDRERGSSSMAQVGW